MKRIRTVLNFTPVFNTVAILNPAKKNVINTKTVLKNTSVKIKVDREVTANKKIPRIHSYMGTPSISL